MAVSGVMKGTIKEYRQDGKLIPDVQFESKRVGRRESELMEVHADTTTPRQIGMGFKLVNINQPSGTFQFPGREVSGMWYRNDLDDGPLPATKGELVFENHDAPGVKRINGKLTFKTEWFKERYFEIEVVFAIDGVGEMSRIQ